MDLERYLKIYPCKKFVLSFILPVSSRCKDEYEVKIFSIDDKTKNEKLLTRYHFRAIQKNPASHLVSEIKFIKGKEVFYDVVPDLERLGIPPVEEYSENILLVDNFFKNL